MNDSLRRDDMKPAVKTPVKTKLVTRYVIVYTAGYGRKTSMRWYERGLAARIVKRLNKNPDTDAYASPFRVHIPA